MHRALKQLNKRKLRQCLFPFMFLISFRLISCLPAELTGPKRNRITLRSYWRKGVNKVITFPSGKSFKVKRPQQLRHHAGCKKNLLAVSR